MQWNVQWRRTSKPLSTPEIAWTQPYLNTFIKNVGTQIDWIERRKKRRWEWKDWRMKKVVKEELRKRVKTLFSLLQQVHGFFLWVFSDVFFPIGFLWAVFFQCIGMGISMLSWYFEVKKLSGWFFFYSHLFLLRVIALKFTIDFNATHPVILWCSA